MRFVIIIGIILVLLSCKASKVFTDNSQTVMTVDSSCIKNRQLSIDTSLINILHQKELKELIIHYYMLLPDSLQLTGKPRETYLFKEEIYREKVENKNTEIQNKKLDQTERDSSFVQIYKDDHKAIVNEEKKRFSNNWFILLIFIVLCLIVIRGRNRY